MSTQDEWQAFLKGGRVRTDDGPDLCPLCGIEHSDAGPADLSGRSGLHQPSSPYLQHISDASPQDRAAMLQGKVWRKTREGYAEIEFASPEPYWADKAPQ